MLRCRISRNVTVVQTGLEPRFRGASKQEFTLPEPPRNDNATFADDDAPNTQTCEADLDGIPVSRPS